MFGILCPSSASTPPASPRPKNTINSVIIPFNARKIVTRAAPLRLPRSRAAPRRDPRSDI